MSNEQIYLYRRKGLSDYATCDRARYVELSQHKLFETMICYAGAEAAERLGIDLELTRLARQGDQIEIDGLKALNDGLRAELGECKGEYDRAVNKVAERDELIAVMLARLNKAQIFGYDRNVKALSASAEHGEPACCTPTAEEKALLASGDHTPEELWGGSRPSCPKCHKAEQANKESAQ